MAGRSVAGGKWQQVFFTFVNRLIINCNLIINGIFLKVENPSEIHTPVISLISPPPSTTSHTNSAKGNLEKFKKHAKILHNFGH